MSDFLEQLNRRLRRKRAEEPIRGSVESNASYWAPPYPEQETEELGDDVIARLNPTTGEIESLEVLFFSTRLLRSDLLELPVVAELRIPA